jgi:hypothetical protein
VLVATDGLFAQADRLADVSAALGRDHRLVAVAEATGGYPLDELRHALRRSEGAVDGLRVALWETAATYAEAERGIVLRQHAVARQVATSLSPVLRLLLLLGIVGAPLLSLIGAGLWGAVPDRGDGRAAELRRWLMAHPELVTSTEFVTAVRLFTTTADEWARGLVGLGGGLVPSRGTVLGTATNAAGTIGLAQLLGMLRETPVTVDRTAIRTVGAAPAGVGERLARIPEGDQVRIERYEAPGRPPRYIVYIGPTETFSPIAELEPWDLTSNVTGVAGRSAGSFRATEMAMRDAGIGPDDEVQFVGFSQGGLVATLLAAAPEWNAVGLETHGAPAGNIRLPPGLAGIAIRNSDDFVPALAGPQLDTSLLQIEREAFPAGRPIPTDMAAPAHQRVSYVETAAAVDAAESSLVRDQISAMDGFTAEYTTTGNATITSFTYHAERLDPPPPAREPPNGGV